MKLALLIFCRSRTIRNKNRLSVKGPLLITANHPNSFLDAVIIGASFKHPIHFLARGDAFTKPWHARLLGLMQMIPIYRLSEGKENLGLNERAFQQSREILARGGILLIFIEGICVNKHELQPFKKGAARIAGDCKGVPGMQVMPLGIAYDSFRRFGKRVIIDAGAPIPVADLLPFKEENRNRRYMNETLFVLISEKIHQLPPKKIKGAQLWVIPGVIGRWIHLPLYNFLKNPIEAKTRNTVFFDSVLFGTLMLAYPVYLFLIAILLFLLQVPASIVIGILLLHPLTAFCAVRQNRG